MLFGFVSNFVLRISDFPVCLGYVLKVDNTSLSMCLSAKALSVFMVLHSTFFSYLRCSQGEIWKSFSKIPNGALTSFLIEHNPANIN